MFISQFASFGLIKLQLARVKVEKVYNMPYNDALRKIEQLLVLILDVIG